MILELWNICRGEKKIIQLNKSLIDKRKLLLLLADIINEQLSNMIFFYDLETTGLIEFFSYPEIIEIYIKDYHTKSEWCNNLVKTDICLDSDVTYLTGINNQLLNTEGVSMSVIKNKMNDIYRYCKDPIFIAHNGNAFDHKLMKYYNLFQNNTKIVDSRPLLRIYLSTVQENIDDNKLSNIFSHFFSENVIIHRAKGDVYMLMKIFDKLNINDDMIKNIAESAFGQ